jgi:FkbM family methyltransferase
LSDIADKMKSAIVQAYIMARHPEAIRLRRKGIRYDHYRDLNQRWLTDLGINTVLDVGANVGDFAKLAREVFPAAAIYSFEPLPECFAQLRSSLPGDTNFFPIETGIGREDGVLDFYRSFHSPSSSFLKMEEFHKEAFPYTSEGQAPEALKINVRTLDGLLHDKDLEPNILLKIDVQGFELEALAGAPETLAKSKVVVIEMSFANLYEGQPLFHDVYQAMYRHGYRFRGSLAQMLHPETGEIVQTDAIFVKE